MAVHYIDARIYYPVQRDFSPDSEFFEDGDLICRRAERSKLGRYPASIRYLEHCESSGMLCDVPTCRASFESLAEFESHYCLVHRHVCQICRYVFPTFLYLNTHIIETHDSLFQVMSQKRPMYECLVEGCARTFWSSRKRRFHMIDFHHFPRSFAGFLLGRGKRSSKEKGDKDMSMDSVDVRPPTSFSFGHRGRDRR